MEILFGAMTFLCLTQNLMSKGNSTSVARGILKYLYIQGVVYPSFVYPIFVHLIIVGSSSRCINRGSVTHVMLG